MIIALERYEELNGALDSVLRAGDFMESLDPRGYIRAYNVLFDLCIETIGLAQTENFPCAMDCAAWILHEVDTGAWELVDRYAVD